MLSTFRSKTRRLWSYLAQTFRLMVGLPDYAAYLKCQRQLHATDCCVMSREEFFRERQEARYGGKKRIGCC